MGVNGAQAVNAMLARKFGQIERAIKGEIQRTGDMIRRDADLNASGIGFFDSSGNYVRISGKVMGMSFEADTGYRIWVDAGKFAAYLEFGTGRYAAAQVAGYNKEWRDIAFQFFVNGKGRLPARPYLYPAWIQNTTGMVERMRTKLRAI